jgi:hypothetical protein
MLEALGFMEKNGRWSNPAMKLPTEDSNTGEPEQEHEKPPVRDQMGPHANELVPKYKIFPDSEEQPEPRAAVEQEVSQLESAGEPVVPQIIAEKLGHKLTQISGILRNIGYAQSRTIDDKSHMMTWEKKESLGKDVAEANG